MSEGILKNLAREAGHDHWHIESGGLSAFAGAPPSDGSVIAARERDIDIGAHRATVFDHLKACTCDLILVHSGEHYYQVLSWDDNLESKTFLLKHFPEPGDPGPEAWVEDPIGQNLDAYRATFRELEAHLKRIVPEIEMWAGRGGQSA
jgi:protein-tyrosine-phosphatase